MPKSVGQRIDDASYDAEVRQRRTKQIRDASRELTDTAARMVGETRRVTRIEVAVTRIEEIMVDLRGALDERAELRDEVTHDGLTGIMNRRGFEQRINMWLAESMPHATVAAVDIDFFKEFNDTHGHLVGDELLVKVAALLRALARTRGGYVARVGGDEFVVIVPLSDVNLGDILAAGVNGTCALSIGLAMGAMRGVPDLMDRADVAMYQCKCQPGVTFRYWQHGDTLPDEHVLEDRRVRNKRTGGEATPREVIVTHTDEEIHDE